MSHHARSVSDVMQREVATLGENDRLDLADDIMRLGRVRHMPVLDGKRLVGMVSNRDLLAASLSKSLSFDAQHRRTFMRAVEVREVMTRALITISPDASLREAARLMLRHQIGALPVVRDGELLGIVSESDLLRVAFIEEDADLDVGEDLETSDVGFRVQREIDNLRRLRDELRVQIHLGKAEARDLWNDLEERWSELEGRAQALADRAEEPLEDIAAAAELVVEEVREGYRRVRDLL
jgi:CBS domain-containing membrane protein